MVTDQGEARRTPFGKCISYSAKATRMWWTRICPNTLTTFHTATSTVCGSSNRRSGGAASDQDVAASPGRGAGRERETTVGGREGSPLRDTAGRGGQPAARQLVHEPSVEGMAEYQTGGAVRCPYRELRGRFRDS